MRSAAKKHCIIPVGRDEMASSHLPLFHPWDCSLNCDVDHHLILFPSLEPLAGAVEELAPKIGPRDAAETKPAECVQLLEGEHKDEYVRVT